MPFWLKTGEHEHHGDEQPPKKQKESTPKTPEEIKDKTKERIKQFPLLLRGEYVADLFWKVFEPISEEFQTPEGSTQKQVHKWSPYIDFDFILESSLDGKQSISHQEIHRKNVSTYGIRPLQRILHIGPSLTKQSNELLKQMSQDLERTERIFLFTQGVRDIGLINIARENEDIIMRLLNGERVTYSDLQKTFSKYDTEDIFTSRAYSEGQLSELLIMLSPRGSIDSFNREGVLVAIEKNPSILVWILQNLKNYKWNIAKFLY